MSTGRSVVELGWSQALLPRVRSVFISDVHLGSRDCRAAALLDFLQRVRTDRLYLVGDIVDLWALRRTFHWPVEHMMVLRRFVELARNGTQVIYVPGNHDVDFREWAGAEICRVIIQRDCVHVTADGRRMLVLHGDEFDGVVKCQPWLAALGSTVYDLTLTLNHHFNGLRRLVGLPYWSLAGYLKSRVANAQRYIANFEQAAAHAARQQGLDGVICGHIHRFGIETIGGVLYANDGDWVESCTALVEDRNGRLALWHWPHESQTRAAVSPGDAVGEAA